MDSIERFFNQHNFKRRTETKFDMVNGDTDLVMTCIIAQGEIIRLLRNRKHNMYD